jgi:hypothetical protein
LNWVFDEFFVEKAVWQNTFAPLDVGFRRVVLQRTGAELDNLVQLDIQHSVDVNVDHLDNFKDCQRCGRRKYWPKYLLGPYPNPMPTDAAIFISNQYFGDGLKAFNLVFVSNRLCHQIKKIGLRGLSFHPTASTE